MKYTLLLLFVLLTSFRPPENNIYICGAKGAKKYHYNENCRGLKSCSREVVNTSTVQAKGLELTLCGWED